MAHTAILMVYDEQLANRIRRVMRGRTDVTDRKMFGGLALLCEGQMCFGIVGNELTVRVPIDELDARDSARRPHCESG